MKKLPGRCTQRTINRLQLTIPIHLNYNSTNALHIKEGKAPFVGMIPLIVTP